MYKVEIINDWNRYVSNLRIHNSFIYHDNPSSSWFVEKDIYVSKKISVEYLIIQKNFILRV